MNYYPNNYYLNYPYGNQYSPQNTMQPQMQMPQTQLQPQSQVQSLNGKIVDSADIVKATEVPIGGYGIFPKADLSEIYIKSWNNNGTTSIITFKPEPPQTAQESTPVTSVDSIKEIKEQIERLETKLDNILAAAPVKNIQTQVQAPAKKEVFF